jgi:predicted unusual protein kinase regulating ubiquinone biosynthesis (AarF/ABC1/UbiB family)
MSPGHLRATLENFLPQGVTPAEKVSAIEAALRSPMGQSMRETLARWIVDEIVPVDRLVPQAYVKWRPPVRDSMVFVVTHLSPARLAPKLMEQIELPPDTAPEVRLLRLIAKVPGLQKLGQVIARNQHLHPALRNALAKLENGIRDVNPDTIRTIVQQALGARIATHDVQISSEILKEASVSAVVRFSQICVPRLIRPLSTRTITALTEEQGIKVTSAAARVPLAQRREIAEQLIEGLVAVPLFSRQKDAVFHGDPHAGNLLYDKRTGKLAIIDWALRERLGHDLRRHLALFFLMVSLRDAVGVFQEISALSQTRIRRNSPRSRVIRQVIAEFLEQLPATGLPSVADAMRLLERVAMKGTKFPASLIMLSKVMFTLEGILGDIVGSDTDMGFAIARHFAQHWIAHRSEFASPLQARDWLTLQCSALLLPSRLGVRWQQAMMNRWLKLNSKASPAA